MVFPSEKAYLQHVSAQKFFLVVTTQLAGPFIDAYEGQIRSVGEDGLSQMVVHQAVSLLRFTQFLLRSFAFGDV
jgi:hypothetical protein